MEDLRTSTGTTLGSYSASLKRKNWRTNPRTVACPRTPDGTVGGDRTLRPRRCPRSIATGYFRVTARSVRAGVRTMSTGPPWVRLPAPASSRQCPIPRRAETRSTWTPTPRSSLAGPPRGYRSLARPTRAGGLAWASTPGVGKERVVSRESRILRRSRGSLAQGRERTMAARQRQNSRACARHARDFHIPDGGGPRVPRRAR